MAIYIRTEKGTREWLARHPSIDPVLHRLLLFIDGRHDAQEILKIASRAGAGSNALEMLQTLGCIIPKPPVEEPSAAALPEAAQASAPSLEPVSRAQSRRGAQSDFEASQRVYHHLLKATKAELGVRALRFHLSLERAQSLSELLALIEPIGEAIARHKGLKAAQLFLRQAEKLKMREEAATGEKKRRSL
ncbi:MAG: hypothetical protein ABSF50_07085 [Burkholderiaceae bacterium]|jgi:hypothetical protein